jgi:cysteinyl-tRNA synthetase
MYSCGPAAGRLAHIGDLRSYLLPDLIRRNAERHRLAVTSCQAIADVGYPAQVARSCEDAFWADCSALNIHPPDHRPRASDSIGPTIELIGQLIDTGHAYAGDDGSVYFDAATFLGYDEAGGPNPDTVLGMRSQADWTLWKGVATGGELTWPAPWGRGFPSRHTVCSAASRRDLGEAIDIDTGSLDLRFPYHEHERAQSDSLAGHEVVRSWVHSENLLFEGSEFEGSEMAQSAGNVVLLADLTRRGLDPLALRLALLEYRYRERPNLTWQALAEADEALRAWRGQVADWATHPSKPMCAGYVTRIGDAFDDDLDTPAALVVLRELAGDAEIPPGSKFETFAHVDRLLGLDLASDVGRAPAPAPPPPPEIPGR